MSSLTPEKALIFRITHIDNVEWTVSNGLHCRNAEICDPNYIQIGNADLINKRANRIVSLPPGGTLADYIPFYFTPYTPMLYNIKTGYNGITKRPMDQIVILVTSLINLKRRGRTFLFTDRHAYLRAARYSDSIDELDIVDWKILQGRDFRRDPNDLEKFERYQAEALIHRHLPADCLLGMVCFGPAQKVRLAGLVAERSLDLEVHAKSGWFF